jgi:hypothetical protein
MRKIPISTSPSSLVTEGKTLTPSKQDKKKDNEAKNAKQQMGGAAAETDGFRQEKKNG